jgi:Skp family chaperone for outer membrane proteins
MLNKLGLLPLTLVLAFPLYVANQPVQAQDKESPIRLGIVDLDEISRKALMSIDMAKQISARRKAFRQEITSMEDKLRKEGEDLQQKKLILAPESFQKATAEYRRKVVEGRRRSQQLTQDLLKLRAVADRELEKEKGKALLQISQQYQFTLIFDRRAVLLRDDRLDLTNLMIEVINKNKASFKLPDDLSKIGK